MIDYSLRSWICCHWFVGGQYPQIVKIPIFHLFLKLLKRKVVIAYEEHFTYKILGINKTYPKHLLFGGLSV